MGKASKSKNFQQQQQQQQCDDLVAIDPGTMPLAHAVQTMDSTALSDFLEQKVLPEDAEVTDCTIEQSRGEAFTGGRSTPVYYIRQWQLIHASVIIDKTCYYLICG